MSFKFQNESNVPVNIAVSNGGVISFHKNGLNPEQTWRCKPAWVWYDIMVFWSTPDNKIDPIKHNWTRIGALSATTVGAALAVGAIAFTGGAATPAVVVAGASVAAGLAGVAFEVANAALNPAHLQALYGVDNYTIKITGGFDGHVDGRQVLTVSRIKPLELHWRNKTSGSRGVVKAK